jgi:hypothetical protein
MRLRLCLQVHEPLPIWLPRCSIAYAAISWAAPPPAFAAKLAAEETTPPAQGGQTGRIPCLALPNQKRSQESAHARDTTKAHPALDLTMALGYNLWWMRAPQVEWFPHQTPGRLYRQYAV